MHHTPYRTIVDSCSLPTAQLMRSTTYEEVKFVWISTEDTDMPCNRCQMLKDGLNRPCIRSHNFGRSVVTPGRHLQGR